MFACQNIPRIRSWLALLVFLSSAIQVHAQRVLSGVSAQEAYINSEVVFQIQVRNAQRHEPPAIPQVDGLKIESAGTPSRSSNLTIINGRRESSSTVIYSFIITPLREGTFTIPPVNVQVDGRMEQTRPHTVVVTTSETGDLLYAEIAGDVQQVYVGQAVQLVLRIWVRPYADRGFEYRFSESDMWQLFSQQTDWGIFADRLEELSLENQRPAGQEVLRKDDQGVSRAYLLYEIEHTMYPKRPGKIDPGNVRIVVNYPTRIAAGRSRSFGDDFFGPSLFDQFTQRRSIQIAASRPISVEATIPPIEVLDVPATGRPADYRGAVGRYRFMVQAEPRRVKVGDPISLKMVIQGDGPMEFVQAPPLAELARDFKVDDKSLAGFVQNDAKLFTTSLRPLREDVKQIPPIPFSFFDPERQEYRTSYSQPITIIVEPNESLSLDSIVAHRKPTPDKQTPEHDNADTGETAGLLDVDQMLVQASNLRRGSTSKTWFPFWVSPMCCLVGVLWWKRQTIQECLHFRRDPVAVAVRSVRHAENASRIRDALDSVREVCPMARQVQRDCDQVTFGPAAQRRSLADLKQAALQVLQKSVVILVGLCCLLPTDSLHAETGNVLDVPPLNLRSQQVQILLSEALADQREAMTVKDTDPVSAKVGLERAVTKYELVLESGFQSSALLRNLADAMAEQGELGWALARLEQARRLSPRDPSINRRIGELRERLGHTKSETASLSAQDLLSTVPLDVYRVLAVIFWSLCVALVCGMLVVSRLRRTVFGCGLVGLVLLTAGAWWLQAADTSAPEAIAVTDAELRSAAGEPFSVVSQLPTGTSLRVGERRGDWLWVQMKLDSSVAGWIASDRVQILQ